MVALVCFIWSIVTALFKSKSRLEVENAALRHQVVVLQRKLRGRVEFTNGDRLFFVLLYRWLPSVLRAIVIVRPETVLRWHRAGFRRALVLMPDVFRSASRRFRLPRSR